MKEFKVSCSYCGDSDWAQIYPHEVPRVQHTMTSDHPGNFSIQVTIRTGGY